MKNIILLNIFLNDYISINRSEIFRIFFYKNSINCFILIVTLKKNDYAEEKDQQ